MTRFWTLQPPGRCLSWFARDCDGPFLDLPSACGGPGRFGAAPGRVKYPCYQRIRRGESHFQMERFWAEDRHNPLPHIALSTTALKSAYSNTALPSTHTAAELRKVLIVGG
jgi:hypothetical protein